MKRKFELSIFLIYLLNWIGAAVLYLILISISIYLIDAKIVKLKYEVFKYIYYFGCGILAWYPCSFILNYYKKL